MTHQQSKLSLQYFVAVLKLTILFIKKSVALNTLQIKHIVRQQWGDGSYDTGGIPTLDGDIQTLEQKLSGYSSSSLATEMRRPMCRKNVAACSPRASNVSTASETKTILIAQRCVFRSFLSSSASTATLQAAIDARFKWLMVRVSGHVKSHTKHMPCKQAPESNHLDVCHRSATDTTAPVWREYPQQWARALWDHWRRCDADDDQRTAGPTGHEHHIGRRFLRRRIDGIVNWLTKTLLCLDAEWRIADAPSYRWAWGCIQKSPEWGDATAGSRSRPTANCAADITLSNFNVTIGPVPWWLCTAERWKETSSLSHEFCTLTNAGPETWRRREGNSSEIKSAEAVTDAMIAGSVRSVADLTPSPEW